MMACFVCASPCRAGRCSTCAHRASRTLKGTVRACVTCGTSFEPRRASQKNCSRPCQIIASVAAAQARAGGPALKTFTCVGCLQEFRRKANPHRGAQAYCSRACFHNSLRANPALVKTVGDPTKNLGYKRRRARIAAQGRDAVNRLRVFDRDGWRCWVCGVDTPATLVGTCEPNAPELDHVVPISRGGAHTYANVRCACRRCNGGRRNRLPKVA